MKRVSVITQTAEYGIPEWPTAHVRTSRNRRFQIENIINKFDPRARTHTQPKNHSFSINKEFVGQMQNAAGQLKVNCLHLRSARAAHWIGKCVCVCDCLKTNEKMEIRARRLLCKHDKEEFKKLLFIVWLIGFCSRKKMKINSPERGARSRDHRCKMPRKTERDSG